MKRCSKCGEEKQRAEFYRNRANRDGLNYKCKACQTADRRTWAARNPDAVKWHKRKGYGRVRADVEKRAEFFRLSLDRHKQRYAANPVAAARMRAKAILVASMGVPIRDIPPDLIDAKAAQLLVKRLAEKGR